MGYFKTLAIEIQEQDPLSKYPLVEGLITDMIALGQATHAPVTTDSVIAKIRREFDKFGPYEFAKANGVLVNGSGEEFAIQFMSFINDITGWPVY